jgi:hypothetical protein
MPVVYRVLVALLLLACCHSAAVAGGIVYLMDSSEIEVESAWIEGDTVKARVNENLCLSFPLAEVDLRKTGLQRQADASPPKRVRPPAETDLVDRLINVIGFRRDFDDMLRPGRDDDMDRLVNDKFNPEVAEKTVKKHLRKLLGQHDLEEVLAWYTSPTGKKLLEAESVWDFNRREKKTTYVSRENVPGYRERMEVSRQIVKTTGIAELETRMMTHLYRRILGTIPKNYPDGEEIKAKISKDMPELETVRQEKINGMAYSYRLLSIGELRSYHDFLRTSSGRKYVKALNDANEEIFRQLAINVERSFREILL